MLDCLKKDKLGSSLVVAIKYWWGDGAILNELHSFKGMGASFDIILVSGE